MVTNISPNTNSPVQHSQVTSQQSAPSAMNGESIFDARKLFYIVIAKWPIILLSLLVAIFGSNLYVRYATPTYAASMKMLIKDTRYSGGMSEAFLFSDIGLLNSSRNLDNEIQILRTSYIMEEVVRRHNLQYYYRVNGRLKSNELYKESPIAVLSWEPVDSSSARTISFDVQIKKNGKLILTLNEKNYEGDLGQALVLPVGKITIGSSEYASKPNVSNAKEINITIKPINQAAAFYSNRLTVTFEGKTRSTVLDVRIVDEKPQRAKDILNYLVEVYNESEIRDKNKIYENTVNFIDDRMNILGVELRQVEGDVASFRSRKGAVDLTSEGNLFLIQETQLVKRFAENEGQLQVVRAIKNQLKSESTRFNFVPTSQSLTNASLASLLNTFNQLLLDRERQISISGSKHPNLELIERQLSNLRLNIIESIDGIERDLMVALNTLKSEEKVINSRISSIPDTEKQLIEIERQQAIKQQLYLYLLQKREEAALSLSVTVANNRVIEPPRFNEQVSPKIKQIRLMAISLGLLLPILILLLSQALNSKVQNESNIIENTTAPILGTIPFSESKDHVAISEKRRSAIAEMFRLLRANIQFVGEGVHNKVILFTSSISGEGKSFITLNTGLTLALGGKKVVVLELDMRKPKVVNYLGHVKGSTKGITDFIVKENISIDEIICKSVQHQNLDYISCGPLPPNPSELLLSEKLVFLMNELKIRYDYILVDTPPIGLVSDALMLNKLVDCTFYIVRQGITEQRQLRIVEDISVNNKMPRVFVVFNGVKYGYGGYGYGTAYGYGYGYRYGYGYGYYTDEKKVPFWKKIFNKKA